MVIVTVTLQNNNQAISVIGTAVDPDSAIDFFLKKEQVYYTGNLHLPSVFVVGSPCLIYSIDLAAEGEIFRATRADDISASNSAPCAFSLEWLQGKTLFKVWFGSGEDTNGNVIENVPVVQQMIFGVDGIVSITGLSNSDAPIAGTTYNVDDDLQLVLGVDQGKGNRLVCGSTDQYIKAHREEDGMIINTELYFFDESDALDYASDLTSAIPGCAL